MPAKNKHATKKKDAAALKMVYDRPVLAKGSA